MSQLSSPGGVAGVADEAAVAAAPSRRADLMTLTKMRITVMVGITAFVGYAVAVASTGVGWHWPRLLAAMAGTAISCMGAAVLNQAFERDTDAMMHRTRNRPLPAGRVGPGVAWALGVALSLVGVGVLLVGTHWLAAALSAATITSYVWVYTPLKRISSIALLVGAAPGAAPPLIGYAAVTGRVDAAAWLIFAIMFVWQVPHFLAIAWLYREDYARSGMPMLPVIDPDGRRTFRQTLIGCLLLLPLGVAPAYLGVSGLGFMLVSLVSGLVFLWFGVRLARLRSRDAARALFLASLVYLPVVLAAMVLDPA